MSCTRATAQHTGNNCLQSPCVTSTSCCSRNRFLRRLGLDNIVVPTTECADSSVIDDSPDCPLCQCDTKTILRRLRILIFELEHGLFD